MAHSSMVHVRLDDRLKFEAGKALGLMGLSISDAVRVFLTHVVAEQRLPFEVRNPNAASLKAMQEANLVTEPRFNTAEDLFNALEKKRQ